MWSNLTKPLSIAAVTLVLFAALVIGMTTLSQNGGEAWGLDYSLSPEEAAQNSFEAGDHRLLGIRLSKNGNPHQSLILGAECWPEDRNVIEYEYAPLAQSAPDSGAHGMRAEYAKRYNLHIAAQLVSIGQECKLWH